jgi:hypothetical protein
MDLTPIFEYTSPSYTQAVYFYTINSDKGPSDLRLALPSIGPRRLKEANHHVLRHNDLPADAQHVKGFHGVNRYAVRQ